MFTFIKLNHESLANIKIYYENLLQMTKLTTYVLVIFFASSK